MSQVTYLLTEVINRFPSIRIVVVGDVILDHYIWGDVNRISPEAPVPVVEVKNENFRLGGAANTVANICSLGGQVDIVSVIGKDQNGDKMREMLALIGAKVDGLLEDTGRPTIVKTRVMARNQQVVRIDRELKREVAGKEKDQIIYFAEALIPKADAVIFSDYDKGVISKDVLNKGIAYAKKLSKVVVIDPKFNNFADYKGATVVTPNIREASAAVKREIIDDESLLYAGNTLLKNLELSAVLITRGEHGMSLFESVGNEKTQVTHIPTVAREVYDVTGAGDTVVAVFTLALAAGASMLDAAMIANCAAGIVVGEVGTASVTKEQLVQSLSINHRLWDNPIQKADVGMEK